MVEVRSRVLSARRGAKSAQVRLLSLRGSSRRIRWARETDKNKAERSQPFPLASILAQDAEGALSRQEFLSFIPC